MTNSQQQQQHGLIKLQNINYGWRESINNTKETSFGATLFGFSIVNYLFLF